MATLEAQPFQLYYETLVRFVANTMVDPHRYFEQKLVGEMRAAPDSATENDQLKQLLDWIDDGLLSDPQRTQLQQKLQAAELPGLELAGDSVELLRILLYGDRSAASADCLREALATNSYSTADRRLLKQALLSCGQEP